MTGRIYYVSKQGLDSGSGSVSEPFFTIQKAADTMQPGDKCIIGEGIYREWIKPPRGGSNEYKRITYTAAEGCNQRIGTNYFVDSLERGYMEG